MGPGPEWIGVNMNKRQSEAFHNMVTWLFWQKYSAILRIKLFYDWSNPLFVKDCIVHYWILHRNLEVKAGKKKKRSLEHRRRISYM